MLARDSIVAALDAALPADIDVRPYASNIDPPAMTTVMVRVDKVRPSPHAGYAWEVEAALLVIAAKVTPGPSDDELEAALQDVLYALDSHVATRALTWTEATRSVYGPEDGDPTNPAYSIAVTTQTEQE